MLFTFNSSVSIFFFFFGLFVHCLFLFLFFKSLVCANFIFSFFVGGKCLLCGLKKKKK